MNNWKKELYKKFPIETNGRGGVIFHPAEVEEFIIKVILKGEIATALDLLWNNDELQEAITDYGEWNATELNKVYEAVKKDILTKL